MYSNIGSKIKGLAVVSAWVGIIASVIIGILIIQGSFSPYFNTIAKGTVGFIGFLVIICGSLSSWVFSWVLYGFGDLIEEVKEISYLSRSKAVPDKIVGPIFQDR